MKCAESEIQLLLRDRVEPTGSASCHRNLRAEGGTRTRKLFRAEDFKSYRRTGGVPAETPVRTSCAVRSATSRGASSPRFGWSVGQPAATYSCTTSATVRRRASTVPKRPALISRSVSRIHSRWLDRTGSRRSRSRRSRNPGPARTGCRTG